MKKLGVFAFLISFFQIYGQAPTGYYDSATGQGYQLKTQLHNIIKNHTQKPYSSLWQLYNNDSYKDIYYENDQTLLDIYSEVPNGEDPYTYHIPANQNSGASGGEGSSYNREHLIPQSVFGSAMPMVSDAHHILPTDSFVNAQRGNLPFGNVTQTHWTSMNGSKRGSTTMSGYHGNVFEPIDEFKGDIARCFFYFATRYQDQIANWSYPMFDGSTDKVFANNFLEILLQWHLTDPVSDRERAINNRIYAFQNNRNPFVDHPDYVQLIWGDALNIYQNQLEDTIHIYPNPVNNGVLKIDSESLLGKVALYTQEGKMLYRVIVNSNYLEFRNLSKGMYLLVISNNLGRKTYKIIVN